MKQRVFGATKGAGRFVGGQVRRHWRSTALIVAFILLFLGPGYSASRADFYERFENLGAYYQTWNSSTHSRVSCQSCHVAPGTIQQGIYATRMVGEIYLSLLPLNREPSTLSAPTNESCDQCHVDLREVSPAGDLYIPHLAHVDEAALGLACTECHDSIFVHAEDFTVPNITTPRMATCMECHDGERAKEECDACHTEKAIPESHQDPQFVVEHSELTSAIDCESCHAWKDEWCFDCHQRRPRSHGSGVNPAEWRKEHRDVVEVRRNCEACHEAPFCIDCHGEVPELNFDPTLTLAR